MNSAHTQVTGPFLNEWDNKVLNFDLEKYPWHVWVLSLIQEVAPSVKELETIHEVLTLQEIVKVQLYVQDALSRREFMERFDSFAEEYGKPLIGNRAYLLKRNPTLNVVIPNQAVKGRKLPFHQGIFYANGRGQRTFWMAVTKCYDSNSMWVVDVDDSRRITKRVISEQWSLERFEEECLKYARPVNIVPGQAHLFNQENIHGNVNNETGVTRMSIDWHLLPEGEEYWRRLPGGFFRLPGDYSQSNSEDYSNKLVVVYTGNNSEFDSDIPMHIQRMCMESYCIKHKMKNVGVQFENEFLHWLPVLESNILQKPDVIVMFSLHSLPDDAILTNKLLNLALKNKVELHFANEFLSLKDDKDLTKILTYKHFGVKKKGPFSWE